MSVIVPPSDWTLLSSAATGPYAASRPFDQWYRTCCVEVPKLANAPPEDWVLGRVPGPEAPKVKLCTITTPLA